MAPGATYRGTHSGGGNFCLTVTADFSGVTGWIAYDVPGGNCRFLWYQRRYPFALPITNRSFSESGSTNINGSFPTDRGAQGTFSLFGAGFPPCVTGAVSWTATTDATPPWVQPPPPPPLPPPPPPAPPPPSPRPRAQVRCRVPNVIGLKLATARTRIKARNCRIGRITRKRSRRVGRVIKQSPRGGAVRARNFRVNLTVGRR